MSSTIIDGRKIAATIQTNVKQHIQTYKKKYNCIPHIVTLKIGNDPASELYLKLRDKACEKVGIHSEHIELPDTTSEYNVIKQIHTLNTNPNIHGILIQYPLPQHISAKTIMETVTSTKDVEGFHPTNLGKLLIGDEHLIPCTPLAVLTILDHEHIKVQGKNCVIINHSTVVGKPLSILLLNRNATVTICHEYTKNLEHFTKHADILVTAAGIQKLIQKNHIKPGATVIDVGIIPTEKGITGDVFFEEVQKIAGKLTPVPGGVGPVTIACALQNMLHTFIINNENKQH